MSDAGRVAMSRSASAPSKLEAIGFAALTWVCLAATCAAHASELDQVRGVQVATAPLNSQPPRVSKRALDDEQGELEALLAQNGAPEPESGSLDTILAGFPMSAPESLEEEVAKTHGLEIVRRFTIESLGKRIVVYRHKGDRPPADVVAALKKDQRVASAQANLRYVAPAPTVRQSRAPDEDAADAAAKQAASKTKARTPQKKVAARASGRQEAIAAKPAPATTRSVQSQGSLVAGKQTALRWPTADEPFVNVGAANR